MKEDGWDVKNVKRMGINVRGNYESDEEKNAQI